MATLDGFSVLWLTVPEPNIDNLGDELNLSGETSWRNEEDDDDEKEDDEEDEAEDVNDDNEEPVSKNRGENSTIFDRFLTDKSLKVVSVNSEF